MGCRMGMGSLGGRMVPFTEEHITMGKGKVMASFIIPKTQVSVEGFGKRVSYKVKESMFNHKERVTNVFGEEARSSV